MNTPDLPAKAPLPPSESPTPRRRRRRRRKAKTQMPIREILDLARTLQARGLPRDEVARIVAQLVDDALAFDQIPIPGLRIVGQVLERFDDQIVAGLLRLLLGLTSRRPVTSIPQLLSVSQSLEIQGFDLDAVVKVLSRVFDEAIDFDAVIGGNPVLDRLGELLERYDDAIAASVLRLLVALLPLRGRLLGGPA